MFKSKTTNLSNVITYIIMAIIYCSVAFYFISIGTNLNQIMFTIISFAVGAWAYFKLSFKKKPTTNEVK
ncbi:hypothetical protein [Intestinibacter bartlettii]|uniref:Uncharacterized protein n=1 Tax=Intestinibacter bartlettii TaxID=261299 RepID=A0ABS6DYD8_9FIRM|nr:hypothetical protein [Intestinibacter bartlettii]MBU5336770.1 hypothetical protein [Intestinibacter bartlettii]MDO5010580.1 hypothetical protein [Intestinibacter bartlettii]